MLSLQGFAYGRLLALSVVSSFAGILLGLHARARIYHVQSLLDRIVCAEAAEKALCSPDVDRYIKPVMVIIAALNEADSLAQLLPRIPRQIRGTEVGILVIDDGSTDATAAVAAKCGCLVSRNSVRRGQGAALRVGYLILRRTHVDFAVTMDADNQHRPEDLAVVLEPLLTDKADFVIGSRVLGSADTTSMARRVGIAVFSRFISLLCGQAITDCSSGFRGFRMTMTSRLDLREDQYQTSEVIIEASKKGLRIAEVPIYIGGRSHGTSRKGSNIAYGFFFVKTMVKTWWR
jgi:glycosyltransferase involved in cell wall biosynthesis